MPKPLRTFVAVKCSPNVCERACDAIKKLSTTAANVRWVGPEQMHWTLAFLGDVRMDDVADVCLAVQRAGEQVGEFSLHVHGIGAFPAADRPRTIWLGASEGDAEMVALHDALELELEQLGIRSERRKYTPHLTLGRVRHSTPHDIAELGAIVRQYDSFDAGTMTVDEVVVFASRMSKSGPSYDQLGRCELASR